MSSSNSHKRCYFFWGTYILYLIDSSIPQKKQSVTDRWGLTLGNPADQLFKGATALQPLYLFTLLCAHADYMFSGAVQGIAALSH